MKNDFLNLLAKLRKAGVDFVIIGGFAGVIHGCTFVTQDIDICCNFTPENLLRLQGAIADLNPVHRMTPNRLKLQLTEDQCKNLKNLYLDTMLGRLDCISFVLGVGNFEKVKAASETIVVDNEKYLVSDIDSLIASKTALNRKKDSQILAQLESIKRLEAKRENL
jgi:hypothetical protein